MALLAGGAATLGTSQLLRLEQYRWAAAAAVLLLLLGHVVVLNKQVKGFPAFLHLGSLL